MVDNKKLLIVDDSKTSVHMIRHRFSKLRREWTIYDSDNGADALEMVVWLQPDYVTMDVNMPQMSGLEVADRIRALSPNTKIVLITANVQESVREHARKSGYGFVEKPIDDDSIPAALRFFEETSDA